VVACSAENNVPVVGRDEVRRRREMHWIRIDRYYSFNEGGKPVTEEQEIDKLADMDNVSVVHQPMLCQHCDHAPCETVCPVLATVHSSEGLSHMAYNRCVGTRYCANNCPYKVRRFNWFNYWNDSRFDNYLNNEHTQLVLNPDVTTRFRGVMEKCSMCIQRIQAGKLKAKMEKRSVKDGDIKVACQQTCPANAIVFGNVNDPDSEVAKALKSERTYYVLEELNVQPGIGYQVKVRNTVDLEA
jgi:molybdopterin-containing oxidoreductase family iron-sulfur binding subunit